MYILINDSKTSIIINKSTFITNLFIVKNTDEVNMYLDKIKKEYKDANHHCYAYIIDNIEKCSDDKEPSGTAGLPILTILKNKNLNYCLCVVTRYFGGIKLGAGGLIRAYSKATKEGLKSNVRELKKGYNITLTFPYNKESIILDLIKNQIIINKSYLEEVTYEVDIEEDLLETLKNQDINIKIKESKYF